MKSRTLKLRGASRAPYLTQWFGLWAIGETALNGLMGTIRNTNLLSHLKSVNAAEDDEMEDEETDEDLVDEGEEIVDDVVEDSETDDEEMDGDSEEDEQAADEPPADDEPVETDEDETEDEETEPMARRRRQLMSMAVSDRSKVEWMGGVMVERVQSMAVVHITGIMMKHQSSLALGTSTVEARRAISQLAADRSVQGILLVLDTPGGTVAGTHELAMAVRSAAEQKPVHAYASDCCCSAGYWVASQASRIAMNETGTTGSIGVFGAVEDSSEAAAKQGIKVHVIKAGDHKGVGTPGAPISDAQLEVLQRGVNSIYETFTQAVAAGRKVSIKQVKTRMADGRPVTGREALDAGMIDSIESVSDAMAALNDAVKGKGAAKPTKAASGRQARSRSGAPASKAATMADIKANCPGVTNDFLVKAIEHEWSIEKSMREWMTQLATGAAKPSRAMIQPIKTAGQNQQASRVDHVLAEYKAAGLSNAQAVIKLNREHPDLAASLGR